MIYFHQWGVDGGVFCERLPPPALRDQSEQSAEGLNKTSALMAPVYVSESSSLTVITHKNGAMSVHQCRMTGLGLMRFATVNT